MSGFGDGKYRSEKWWKAFGESTLISRYRLVMKYILDIRWRPDLLAFLFGGFKSQMLSQCPSNSTEAAEGVVSPTVFGRFCITNDDYKNRLIQQSLIDHSCSHLGVGLLLANCVTYSSLVNEYCIIVLLISVLLDYFFLNILIIVEYFFLSYTYCYYSYLLTTADSIFVYCLLPQFFRS